MCSTNMKECPDAVTSGTESCDFGVARDGRSSAVVVVYDADGTRANFHFAGTEFIFADDPDGVWAQNAAVGAQDDAVVVTVGTNIYTIPNSIIVGENQ